MVRTSLKKAGLNDDEDPIGASSLLSRARFGPHPVDHILLNPGDRIGRDAMVFWEGACALQPPNRGAREPRSIFHRPEPDES